jgi:hypothetical protein
MHRCAKGFYIYCLSNWICEVGTVVHHIYSRQTSDIQGRTGAPESDTRTIDHISDRCLSIVQQWRECRIHVDYCFVKDHDYEQDCPRPRIRIQIHLRRGIHPSEASVI